MRLMAGETGSIDIYGQRESRSGAEPEHETEQHERSSGGTGGGFIRALGALSGIIFRDRLREGKGGCFMRG